jgi:phosphate-selective porin OprO/OprP
MIHNFKKLPLLLLALALIFGVSLTTAFADQPFSVGYEDGFYLRSNDADQLELRLGGALQTDYRYYAEEERADNRFDIRKARLIFEGTLTRWFDFGLEFDFQGNETNNLIEAYGQARFSQNHALRFGQFKEPFSLEWQTVDTAQWFAERSMGYDFGPKRDVGLMLQGSFFGDAVNYGAGLFNGDGRDGSGRGNRQDVPEAACRLVAAPFKHTGLSWLQYFQVGGSATYANIDLSNVDVSVKTTGMVGTNRNIYVLTPNTKFGVLYDAENRMRGGIEAAWALGPVALAGELMHLRYTDLVPSGGKGQDADFSSWYVAGLWCLTGEKVPLGKGVFTAVRPERPFDPGAGTYGALLFALRADHFYGDKDWITPGAFVSVREAEAYSAALTWILHPMHRLMLDYTHTDLKDPIRVRVLPDGSEDYIEEENVVTLRYSLDF